MVEIEFSLTTNDPNDVLVVRKLLEEFQAQQKVSVRLSSMTWEDAWQELFTITMQGKGPDVSHVGSTWSRSLVEMNALRPFRQAEVEAVGGSKAFIPANWESATIPDDEGDVVWSIPWTSYLLVFAYRRDRLQQAGINEQTAFKNARAIQETVQRLQAFGVEIPLALTCNLPATDLLHTTASWVWGAGGDFVSPDGKTVLFNRPEAMAGLQAFFSLYSNLPASARAKDPEQTLELFLQERAAILIANPPAIRDILRQPEFAAAPNTLGTAALSSTPWLGGENLVIWRHTQGYPERERVALALVNYLAGNAAQVRHAQLGGPLPARLDSLKDLAVEPECFKQTLQQAVKRGRPYHSVPLWRRVEYQLSQELVVILDEVLASPAGEVAAILHQHLDPLARRLELTLNR